jgi:hypothetical protein
VSFISKKHCYEKHSKINKNMKTLITALVIFSLYLSSFSQENPEELFKYPLEMERESKVYPLPGPVNTNPSPSIFFNINISQHSAPQNEPSVGISRKNPNRVVAAWRDFRYGVDPNANRRVGYSYSTNAGLTWSNGQILDSTLLPNLTRNSDPVVVADTAGNFYIAVVAISPTGGNLTLAVYKSFDGGMTFPNAYIASQTGIEDKEWITCDISPVSPYVNRLYISWTSFSLGGDIVSVRSSNGGANWSEPVPVSEPGASVQGSNICVSRNGQVNVCWLQYSSNANIFFDRSTNGGAAFGTDVLVSSGTFPSGLPNSVGTFPSIAVDNSTGPRSGWIYVTFADNRNGDCDVFLSRSTNNGVSWSGAVRVNNDAMSNGKIQYWPAIAVNETGNIAIIFMDTRNTANNTIIEAFIARSYDGGFTFANEVVSSDQSPTNIPGSNVRFGDYIDIDYQGLNIVPVWTDERAGGFNMDIFTAEISELLGTPVANTIPDRFELYQNYPNPFNPTTRIRFEIPSNLKSEFCNLKLYDVLGRQVAVLVDNALTPGTYELEWNASAFPSGIYFYTLTADGFSDTKKMLMIK